MVSLLFCILVEARPPPRPERPPAVSSAGAQEYCHEHSIGRDATNENFIRLPQEAGGRCSGACAATVTQYSNAFDPVNADTVYVRLWRSDPVVYWDVHVIRADAFYPGEAAS